MRHRAPTCGQTNPAPRILRAHDDIFIRELSVQVCMGSGFGMHMAEGGAAGWEVLHANSRNRSLTDRTKLDQELNSNITEEAIYDYFTSYISTFLDYACELPGSATGPRSSGDYNSLRRHCD